MHADLTISVDDASPRAARDFVAAQLRAWDYDEATVEVVELLTSELVTNVLRHAAGDAALSLEADSAGVRVGVSDTCAQRPVHQPEDLESESGRGVAIVDALASRWGVDPHPNGGKTVWFRAAEAPVLDRPQLRVGDPVEVFSAFNRTWVRGFTVADVVPGGYQIRRSSDGGLLPAPTSPDDVRAAIGSNHPSLG